MKKHGLVVLLVAALAATTTSTAADAAVLPVRGSTHIVNDGVVALTTSVPLGRTDVIKVM